MCERDMMYGGFYQNMPGNISYGNFGYQGAPGTMMPNNMMMGYNPYIENTMNNMGNNNPLIDINARLNNLENRVNTIEKKLSNTNSYQDDNSMYML